MSAVPVALSVSVPENLRRRRISVSKFFGTSSFRRILIPAKSSCLKHRGILTNSETVKCVVENAFGGGLRESSAAVGICRTITLPVAVTLAEAGDRLKSAVGDLRSAPPPHESGILRFQVPLSQDIKALEWLQSQSQGPALLPRCYFSSRCYQGSIGESLSEHVFNNQSRQQDQNIVKCVAGIGSAILIKSSHPFSLNDWNTIRRFLSKDSPLIRAYGAIRFDSRMKPSSEWAGFGSFYFFIPQMELDECKECSLLAATIAWDHSHRMTFKKAIDALEMTMNQVSAQIRQSQKMHCLTVINKINTPDEKSWDGLVQKVLKIIDSSSAEDWQSSLQLGGSSIFNMRTVSKVVLARRSKLEIDANIDPLDLVSCLQKHDQNAYQFCFELPNQSAFVGSTPEKLFYRSGDHISSEAVAGTRARGRTVLEDLQIGLDLMNCSKDQHENDIVKETIKEKLETICHDVIVESKKSLIKQARLQHLRARFVGKLKNEAGEFALLSLLHPTPAVCGHPREAALDFISENELFDRGMYAGPVGWFGGKEAEFAVGIRSALIQKDNLVCSHRSNFAKGTILYLYAGAGIVKGSIPSLEWQELDLKFEALFHSGHAFNEPSNINALWTSLLPINDAGLV